MFVTEVDILVQVDLSSLEMIVITTSSTTTDLQDWLPAYALFTSEQIQDVLVLVVEWKKHTPLVATDLNFKK
jgi:hypothetical protein